MAWPPTPLPNNRDNSTPQNDNHPTDHNDIANTLAQDFVGQINDNIADIGGNAGGIASNLGLINSLLANFVPGGTPVVRGAGARQLKANNDDIGDGRMRVIVPNLTIQSGGDLNLTTAWQSIPGTSITIPTNDTDADTIHVCIGTFTFNVSGFGAAIGTVADNGAPSSIAQCLFGVDTSDHASRATVTTVRFINPGTDANVTIELQAILDPGGVIGQCRQTSTRLLVFSFSK